MSELSGTETAVGVVELEWPEEVGGLLKVGANSEDLVDEILHADDTVLAEVGLDQSVVGKSNSLLLDLSVTTLVDQFTDSLEVWVSIGDPWLDNLEHLQGSLGHTDKDTIVDLQKTEKLEDLARLGCNLVDTLDTDDEDKLVLGSNVVRTLLFGNTGESDLLTLCVTVLLDVLLSTLEDDTTLLLLSLLLLLKFGRTLFAGLLLTLALLQESLRDENLILSWNTRLWC